MFRQFVLGRIGMVWTWVTHPANDACIRKVHNLSNIRDGADLGHSSSVLFANLPLDMQEDALRDMVTLITLSICHKPEQP